MDWALLFGLLLSIAGFSSSALWTLALGWRILGRKHVLLFYGGCWVLWLWSMLVLGQVLLLMGGFHVWTLLVILVIGWGLSLGCKLEISKSCRALRDDLYHVWGMCISDRFAFTVLCVCVGFLCVLGWRGLLLPPLAHDALMYHGPKAAFFVQHGGWILPDAPGGWGSYRLYPPGQEILLAWFLLPAHRLLGFALLDLLAGSTIILLLAGLWQAWIHTGSPQERSGEEEPAQERSGEEKPAQENRKVQINPEETQSNLEIRGVALLLSVLCAIPVFWKSWGAGYNELLLSSTILAGVLLMWRGHAEQEGSWICIGLMAWGIAASTKLPGIVLAGTMFVLWITVALWKPSRTWVTWGSLGWLLAVLVNLPWLGYNTLQSGYPLTPYPLSIAGITLGKATDAIRWLGQHDLAYGWRHEWEAFLDLFRENPRIQGPVLSPMFGLMALGAPLLCIGLRKRAGFLIVLLCLVFMGNVVGFYNRPFQSIRIYCSPSNARFWMQSMLLIVLVWMISLDHLRRFWRWGRVLQHMLIVGCLFQTALYVWGFEGWSRHEAWPLTLLMLGMCGVLTGGWWLWRWDWRAALGLGIASMLGTGLYLGAVREQLRFSFYQESQILQMSIVYYVPSLVFVNQERSLHIAFTAGAEQMADNQVLLPYFGERLQNHIHFVPLARKGQFLKRSPTFMIDALKHADRETWLRRLERLHIDYVVALQPMGPELSWMERLPRSFERVYGKRGSWGVFRRIQRRL